jgi:2-keto-3-deoxy-6-phosphogluconate aldolase
MAVHKWAFIYESPGFSPEANTTRTSTPQCEFIAVGVDMTNKERALAVARDLVAEGVQMIEICGGFGPEWITRIAEAVDHAVPIGGVFYGPEERQRMLDIGKGD